jgi:hypothetical protein
MFSPPEFTSPLSTDIALTWQSVPFPDGFEPSFFRPLFLDAPLLDELIQQKTVDFLRRFSTVFCLSF